MGGASPAPILQTGRLRPRAGRGPSKVTQQILDSALGHSPTRPPPLSIPGRQRQHLPRFRWCLALPGERLQVRLVNGSSRCDGTVEIWFRQSWQPVCGALWERDTSHALCSWLDCGQAHPLELPVLQTPEPPPGAAAGNASWAPNTTWVPAPAVQCSRPEWLSCKVVERGCLSEEWPVQVSCTGTSGPTRTCRQAPCPPHLSDLRPLPLSPVHSSGPWGPSSAL